MTDVVRLSGEDAEVEFVVAAARPLVAAHAVPGWAGGIVRLVRERGREQPVRVGWVHVVWWVVYALGVAAGFSGMAVMLPGKGDPGLDMVFAIGGVATPVAAVVLGLLALLPFPRTARGRPEAYALAACVLAVAVLAVVRNTVRFDELGAAVGTSVVWWWLVGAAVVMAACVALVVRGWRWRADSPARPVYDAAAEAARLARSGARGRGVGPKWRRIVAALPDAVSAPVRAQALDLGPFAYVAWAYFHSEYRLPPPNTLLGGHSGRRSRSR